MAIDARKGYDVWLQLIADEELYRHTIAGTHRELAERKHLGDDELAILDAFHAEKGTRWNIENLRFRTAITAGGSLASYMPRTCRMLTNGDDNWLQDIAFEYLAFYRWTEHGHYRFAECERFGEYVRERIMKRRITPPHLEVVLDFELAVVRLLKKTAHIDRWPEPPELTDEQLVEARVCRAEAVELVELPVDIRAWVESGDPLTGTVQPQPVTLLIYVPSLRDKHRIKMIGEGLRVVLEHLGSSNDRTVGEVASVLEDDYGIERAELLGMIRDWLGERILMLQRP
jgi:hypothetical protein